MPFRTALINLLSSPNDPVKNVWLCPGFCSEETEVQKVRSGRLASSGQCRALGVSCLSHLHICLLVPDSVPSNKHNFVLSLSNCCI